ncbi:PepSY domain-containing protein [Halorussus litoreus]|uniref:PepSY domain-containing protein n=1 Tax=Halorussus litoreus TaxID=1710536 RepID=UPI000E253935|nr:hypothetical protein [Halorussus litoreus]
MGGEHPRTGWLTVGSWAVLGVCALLVVGVLSVAGAGGAWATEPEGSADALADEQTHAPTDAETHASTDAGVTQQGANNTTNVTIPVVEAMGAAGNETNGTPVGAELSRDTNVTDLERPTMIYRIDVLLPNDSIFVVDVNATDGSVREVRQSENGSGLFDGLFGGDEGVPTEQAEASSIRSAIEAVELLRNQTGENATVTSVELSEQDGQLRYTIETVSGEGIQSTAVVAANPDEDGVLTTEAEGGG